jgi:hypothetical protein
MRAKVKIYFWFRRNLKMSLHRNCVVPVRLALNRWQRQPLQGTRNNAAGLAARMRS